jgi:dihydroorotase
MEKISPSYSGSFFEFRNFLCADPRSEHFGKSITWFVKHGRVVDKDAMPEERNIIDGLGKWAAPGFFDIGAQMGIPGMELSETLETGTMAAIRGGYTGVLVIPGALSPTDNVPHWLGLQKKASELPIDIFFSASATLGSEGSQMSCLHELHDSGALCFSDGDKPIVSNAAFKLVLEYLTGFSGLLLHQPGLTGMNPIGHLNEGNTSVMLGLKGIPEMEEWLGLVRDIEVCEYLQAPIHFINLTTVRSLNYLIQAKAKNPTLSAGVGVLHLVFDEGDITHLKSDLKVFPPLRSEEDKSGLLKGIINGDLQLVSSLHRPLHDDLKDRSFEESEMGAATLETVFRALLSLREKGLTMEKIIEILSIAPRELLKLEIPGFNSGDRASYVFFDTQNESIVTPADLSSKSSNNPFLGTCLPGRIEGVFHDCSCFMFT